ncbi:MAG: hypothetical protein AABX77_00045 [Nanoarchaeota archaeon]
MKIGTDLDDCLAEFVFSFCNYYNNKHKTNFEFKDFKHFELWKTLGGDEESVIKEIYDFYDTNYFENLPVIFLSRICINELKKDNDLFIITSRERDFIGKTDYWINQHYPNKFSDVIFTGEGDNKGAKTKKTEICNKLGIDLFIEDNLDNALDCAKGSRKVLLLDKPWNQNGSLPSNINRVYNWNEILENYYKLNKPKTT